LEARSERGALPQPGLWLLQLARRDTDRAPADVALSGTLLFHAPAIPEFNTVLLPYELVEDAQVILRETAGQFFNLRK